MKETQTTLKKENNQDLFEIYSQDLINTPKYNKTISLLREFFAKKGFLEVHTQCRLSILAACEDPSTVQTYTYEGRLWPLPQTGQMWLEYELLKQPKEKGFFCISTSYRQEPNPIPGRHKTIFPMFEFETHGGVEELKKLERELVVYLGIAKENDIKEGKYLDIAKKYSLKELGTPEEEKIYKDFGNAFFLTHFPTYTSPFWNMRVDGEISRKVDVILCGQETIGSAERAVDPKEMSYMFHNISEGGYAKLLYDKFGEERVNRELDAFLKLDFFQRCGGGIGVTRLMRAMELTNNL